ncbi:MAG: glycosyltransferase family 2 protein [Pyrinomonadaceae bacterium]|nr:glycosyltransferase family 2 protein [Sphingobacteriaceae bacterium]
MELGVSVIICCYNSAGRLPETIKHLAEQQVPSRIPWEVIVINNASKDDTANLAFEEWSKYNLADVNFTVEDQPIPGLIHARKKGIEIARYEYLLFCDDDNWLNAHYISTAFTIMNSDKLIGVLGGCGIVEAEQPVHLSEDLLKQTTVSGAQSWALTDHWVYGAGALYRKSILVSLTNKGWEQITTGRTGSKLVSGEDVEICFMIYLSGYKIIADDRLTFKHFVPLKRQSTAFIIHMAFWLSYTNVLLNSYYAIIHKNKHPIKKNIDDWFWNISKTVIKQLILQSCKSFKVWEKPTTEQKIAIQSIRGTFYGLLLNRKKIVTHHYLIKNILSSNN